MQHPSEHGLIRPINITRFRKISRKTGIPDFASKVTDHEPWVCFSNEFGVSDLSAAGGLGYLAGDWVLLAGKMGIPFVGVGLYYSHKWKQTLDEQFRQTENHYKTPDPEFYNFKEISLRLPSYISNGTKTDIRVYSKEISGNTLLMLHETGMRGLYEGQLQSEHRLYQSAVLGFIGVFALTELGVGISILHLNESSTVFAGIAWLDILIQHGHSLASALQIVKRHTIFTNHTLSPAAEPIWTEIMMEKYVFGNITSKALIAWLTGIINTGGGNVRLSSLAIKIAGHSTAVSRFHAVKASASYNTTFVPITNAIANRWIYYEILHSYRELHVSDSETDFLPSDYTEKLKLCKTSEMREIKQRAKEDLCNYLLAERTDQYGNPVVIPEDATIAVWARRLDGYKRPGLLFTDPIQLAAILEKHHMHIILSGKAHQTDQDMKVLLQKLLQGIDNNKTLKERVHFVVNYNWQLARYFGGADIILNTPVPGWEACGTSWEKAVANWLLLCSTRDGGASDIFFSHPEYSYHPPYFEITGTDDAEAAVSLYVNLDSMGNIMRKPTIWKHAVQRQLDAFLPIISGTRMMLEYLTLRFHKK